jgi:hypothetical protein
VYCLKSVQKSVQKTPYTPRVRGFLLLVGGCFRYTLKNGANICEEIKTFKNRNIMQNPFENIDSRLQTIESYLVKFDDRFTAPSNHNQPDRYECGVQVACEELGTKPQTIYQNIENIPHRKLHGKLYFNRAELQQYIKNEGAKK